MWMVMLDVDVDADAGRRGRESRQGETKIRGAGVLIQSTT